MTRGAHWSSCPLLNASVRPRQLVPRAWILGHRRFGRKRAKTRLRRSRAVPTVNQQLQQNDVDPAGP
jgi:hypothetical protein